MLNAEAVPGRGEPNMDVSCKKSSIIAAFPRLARSAPSRITRHLALAPKHFPFLHLRFDAT